MSDRAKVLARYPDAVALSVPQRGPDDPRLPEFWRIYRRPPGPNEIINNLVVAEGLIEESAWQSAARAIEAEG